MPGYTFSDDVTLKNKIGADTDTELQRIEADYVVFRRLQINLGFGPKGHFDAEHLKAFHRHLFQDVFEWAGHTRNEPVKLSDGTVATEAFLHKSEGKGFLIGPQITVALDRVGRAIEQANYLHGLSRAEFSHQAADIMADLNAIHPFREGNGRTQRVFIEQLALQAGHRLDFSVVSKERMIRASIAAHENEDYSGMRRMFNEISDPSRVAPLRDVIGFFSRQGFAWNDHYLATTEPGHKVDVVMGGVGGDHFFARAQTEILIGKVSDLPEPRPVLHAAFTLVPAAGIEAAPTTGAMDMGDSIITAGLELAESTEQSLNEIGAELGVPGFRSATPAPQVEASPDLAAETPEQLQHRLAEERKAALMEKANLFGIPVANERVNERDIDQEIER